MGTPTYKKGERQGEKYRTHIDNSVRCDAVRRYGHSRTRCWRRFRVTLPSGANVCYQCEEALKQGDPDFATLQDDKRAEAFIAFMTEHVAYTGSDEDFITTHDVVQASGVDLSAQRAGRLFASFIRGDSKYPEPPAFRKGWKGYLGYKLQ